MCFYLLHFFAAASLLLFLFFNHLWRMKTHTSLLPHILLADLVSKWPKNTLLSIPKTCFSFWLSFDQPHLQLYGCNLHFLFFVFCLYWFNFGCPPADAQFKKCVSFFTNKSKQKKQPSLFMVAEESWTSWTLKCFLKRKEVFCLPVHLEKYFQNW